MNVKSTLIVQWLLQMTKKKSMSNNNLMQVLGGEEEGPLTAFFKEVSHENPAE